jgi:hypothetical protein
MRRDMAFSRDAFLDNNGGFSSVRYRFLKKQINLFHSIMIFYKGDGKSYQLRVSRIRPILLLHKSFYNHRSLARNRDSAKNFYPSFRGRKNQPNFPKILREIPFLIGTKRMKTSNLLLIKSS